LGAQVHLVLLGWHAGSSFPPESSPQHIEQNYQPSNLLR
jgi:hypothetical protein